MSYTPGPWHWWTPEQAAAADFGPYNGPVVVTDEADQWIICEVASGIEGDPEHANARLIAAAPDLLNALEQMVANAEVLERNLASFALVRARAAIARAKG